MFDTWFKRNPYEQMEKELTHIIEHAPDTYYLAMFMKPHRTHPSLEYLYRLLESPDNCAIYIPSAIQQVIIECKENQQVFEFVKLFNRTFYY